MLEWLNAGQREIAALAPDASAKIANLTLAAGTKQTLPSDLITLLKVVRNMGVGGATAGEVPRRTTAELLDLQRPTWHADTATLVVKNWVYDPRLPGFMYVYPPMSGATTVEIQYSAIPTDVADHNDPISLDDTYANPLLDYMLWRAFSKDVEIPGMYNNAASHRAAFERTLGVTRREPAA